MTGQLADRVIYNGAEFNLVGIDGSELFIPENFGLELTMASTACYNGYLLYFKCDNKEFLLDKLLIRTQEKPVEINGKKAKKYKEENSLPAFFSHQYNNLNLKINFTGKIIIARDFVDGMYVHMGYQKPFAFREVYELTIKDDNIIEVTNLSQRMEEKRKEDPFKDNYPTNPEDGKNIQDWITRRFSREIDE